ncbi:MAG: type VI secretion system baseplate subunit TssF [Planctomycetes bacterium]|nr:type VI secretion system baseplate subunit TssF [Planctomycetota bacterium]
MATNTYYQDELRYLREVGPEFARANPEIARYLSDRGSDPDVERVLAGVAFMCGRVRQKLDDELPELTASMMGLLWPQYLRPVCSMTIMELSPDLAAMQAPQVVEAGAEFASTPIDGTRCRYRSAWPMTLRPCVVDNVRLESAAARPVQLIVRLRAPGKATLDKLELDSVRFFMFGDPMTSFTLYLLLAAHVDHVVVSDGSSAANRPERRLAAGSVSAAGLDRASGVLPYPKRSFPGYRLLQEYFACKERFLFIDVAGIAGAIEELALTDTVELGFTFNRRLDTLPVVSRENVRLHCVPALNLFEHTADPIRLRQELTQHLVLPSKSGVADRRHVEIYSIEEVRGLIRSDELETREYRPFYSFDHVIHGDPRGAAYYQTHLTPNVVSGDLQQGTDTYISFVSGDSASALPDEETISIELLCTNRDLPTALRAGDISEPTDSSPSGATFRNLIKPTPTISPPLGKGLHWRLISHMSLNYVSLTSERHFKELLRVYDFQAEHDAQAALAHDRMMEGIVSIKSSFGERLIRGAAVRGSKVTVELNEDHFAGEGDAYLFAAILDRFMALYATLNAYTETSVRMVRSGQVYSFPPRWGEQLTPVASRGGA